MFKRSGYALIAIVAWSVLVHVPGLTSPLLDYHAYRQCQTASVARNYERHGMHFLSPELDFTGLHVRTGIEFPIYSYLLALLFRLFGSHDILGRLLSAACAAGGAVFLFLFVRRRLGSEIAFWSAIVMCSIPVHIYFTRTVQPEPMALMGMLGFLYFADDWLNGTGASLSWVLALGLGALAPLLKLPFLYLLFPLWLFLGVERHGSGIMKKGSWLLLVALLVAMTEAWYYYAKTAPVVFMPLTMKEHLQNLAPLFTRRLWQAQFVSRIPELVLTYPGILFIGLGWKTLRRSASSSFFLGWLAASIVYVPLLGEYGMIHRYTLLPLAPLAAIAIACGIFRSLEKVRGRTGPLILTGILIIGIPLHAALRIKHWYALEYPYAKVLHDLLASVSRPDDLILVSTDETPVLLYNVDRFGYIVSPSTWQPEQVDRLVGAGAKFIVIPLEDNGPRLREWRDYLERHGTRVNTTSGYWLYRMVGSTPVLRQG